MTSEMALCIPGRLVFGYKLRLLSLSSLFAEKQRGHVLRVVVFWSVWLRSTALPRVRF